MQTTEGDRISATVETVQASEMSTDESAAVAEECPSESCPESDRDSDILGLLFSWPGSGHSPKTGRMATLNRRAASYSQWTHMENRIRAFQ